MYSNIKIPGFNDGEKEIIRQAGNYAHYSRGSNIFVAGDPADRVYLVEKGWVKIYRVSRDGRQVTVGSLRRPGELMGLAEALSEGVRSCYAGAVTDVEVSVIPWETFLQLMSTEPFLAVKVAKILAGRMRDAESGIYEITSNKVSARLARLLLNMARTCGTPEKDGIKLNIHLTHEELAAMVGSSRQTVSSFMGELKKERSIITERGKIRIIKPDSLARRIN